MEFSLIFKDFSLHISLKGKQGKLHWTDHKHYSICCLQTKRVLTTLRALRDTFGRRSKQISDWNPNLMSVDTQAKQHRLWLWVCLACFFFFNSGPVCMTQSAALSSRVLFWVEKAKRFWQHCIPNRVESDLGSVGFSGPRLGCVLIAVEKLPPCALVLIRRCRRLSMLLLQCI